MVTIVLTKMVTFSSSSMSTISDISPANLRTVDRFIIEYIGICVWAPSPHWVCPSCSGCPQPPTLQKGTVQLMQQACWQEWLQYRQGWGVLSCFLLTNSNSNMFLESYWRPEHTYFHWYFGVFPLPLLQLPSFQDVLNRCSSQAYLEKTANDLESLPAFCAIAVGETEQQKEFKSGSLPKACKQGGKNPVPVISSSSSTFLQLLSTSYIFILPFLQGAQDSVHSCFPLNFIFTATL